MPEAGLDFHIRWLKLIHRNLQNMGKNLNNLKMIKQTKSRQYRSTHKPEAKLTQEHLEVYDRALWYQKCLPQTRSHITSALNINFFLKHKIQGMGKHSFHLEFRNPNEV